MLAEMGTKKRPKSVKRTLAILAVLAVALIAYRIGLIDLPTGQGSDPAAPPAQGQSKSDGEQSVIAKAFAEELSDVLVEGSGVVDRTLPDDQDGSRHQRFILRLADGTTILVAHNIDLADRVPLHEGDQISFKGEYEWNEKGGVVHWTHHDPRGSRAGGWLRHRGKTYE